MNCSQGVEMKFIKKLDELTIKDISLVGGKTASLGEMIQNLSPLGIKIPPGFAITADAFTAIIDKGHLNEIIHQKLENIKADDIETLAKTGKEIRNLIKSIEFPSELRDEILLAYKKLSNQVKMENCDLAVRSSATAEDLPNASFAGQQESFLNIRGENDLLEACKNCFASLFTDRAISYRISRGFKHELIRLSICVQKMVRSDLASSGVIFTLDPESGARNVILISSSYGLGENIVGGKVDPDEFIVQKELIEKSPLPIIKRKLGAKQMRLVYARHGTRTTKNVEVSPIDRNQFSIMDNDVLKLSIWAKLIEQHYSKIHHTNMPMDIEWAKDGYTNELFVLQARPETVHSQILTNQNEIYSLLEKGKTILKGRAVGAKIGKGKVRIIRDVDELSSFLPGEILVTDMTDPDWEPVMKMASAIVTNRGGRTCHAAIISREHGVPCLVGTGTATESLKNNQNVTVTCAQGDEGYVLEGLLKYSVEKIELELLKQTSTQLMVNVGHPNEALKISRLPAQGVGLSRIEFIISDTIKIHPMALVKFKNLQDESTKDAILKIIGSYADNPEQFFVDKLAEGISSIAGAFYPRPVIVRFSDFKTNEYSNLIGGKFFEPKEDNPMLGFRGASRYYSEQYREGFALECKAIKKVREEIGLTNVKVMIPFCRTPSEGNAVIEEMKKNHLQIGKEHLQVYVMAEIPSNILCASDFAMIFNGFSIGSNDLTQLVLGIDRGSEILADLFDERNPAVLKMISMAIMKARQCGVPIGICGQAPSDYPDFTQFLIDENIDSISVSPDVFYKTLKLISRSEVMHLHQLENGNET